jgi:adenosylcobinamide kinase / adenosylcobinamide-phosphate guanylyltransferase
VSGQIVLVGGGVRSGKSAFALSRAEQLGTRRVFIATAEALDDEMRRRAHDHRLERGDRYRTLEEPRELVRALAGLDATDVVVIDCLTLWLTNLLVDGLDARQIDARVGELAAELERRRFHAVLVTNEVGLGIVPDNALARTFRDAAGRAHQRLGRTADELYFGMMGQLVRLKPAPLATLSTLD